MKDPCVRARLSVDLNLLSWSTASNMVALVLYRSVYLWNAANGSITELCELPATDGNDYYSSVSFMPSDAILAIGNSLGSVQVLDKVVILILVLSSELLFPLGSSSGKERMRSVCDFPHSFPQCLDVIGWVTREPLSLLSQSSSSIKVEDDNQGEGAG